VLAILNKRVEVIRGRDWKVIETGFGNYNNEKLIN